MLQNLTMVVDLVAVQYRILEYMEMMKTMLMKKLMMNLINMLMMNNGNLDVQADGHISSFRTFNQVLENEQGIYVSTHAPSCDVSNNPDAETLDESSPVHYHLPPTPQFEHVENLGNVISSAWTPWVQHSTGYSSGEFVVGQVFNFESDLQEAAKIYSIKAHQEFVVVASSKKLLVLRCKKAEECQCLWKLCAMVLKDTFLFVINKYKGSHTCVNPCLNRDHHQLDSNMGIEVQIEKSMGYIVN